MKSIALSVSALLLTTALPAVAGEIVPFDDHFVSTPSVRATRAVSSLADVASFFGGAKAQYNQQGVAGTRPDVQCVEWYTDHLASVTVNWPSLDGEGRELGRSESSTYLVRVDKGQAKIFAVLMMGVNQPAASPG